MLQVSLQVQYTHFCIGPYLRADFSTSETPTNILVWTIIARQYNNEHVEFLERANYRSRRKSHKVLNV